MCSCIGCAARWIKIRRCSTPSEESGMSFAPLDFLRRSIGVRLSLWYALIFLVSNAALFVLAYYLLAAAVGSKDRELLDGQLKEAASLYAGGGVAALRNWVQNQPEQVQNTLLVQLVNSHTHLSMIINVPKEWVQLRDVPGLEGLLQEK